MLLCSYAWQAIYIAGLVFSLIYLIWEKSTAGWVSMGVEIVLAFVLVGKKQLHTSPCQNSTLLLMYLFHV